MAAIAEAQAAKGPVMALDARWYTDPRVFELEKTQIFARTWQFACHQSRLGKAGDFFSFKIGQTGLFLVRDRAGDIRCFHNVCRHRAHELVEGSGSRPFIVCPYHGWRYDLDGSLKSAPGEDRVPGFDRSCIRLREVRIEMFCGFVFVNLDDDAEPMAAWYPGAEEEMRAFLPGVDTLRPVAEIPVVEACNWKVSVENYSECYHCKLRHPTFASGVIDPESYDVSPQGHCLRHTTRSAQSEKMTYAIDTPNPHAREYSSWFLWPTISFQVYPGSVLNTYLWRATDHRQVTVTRGWYTPEGVASEQVDLLAQQDLETTVAEDILIVESVQRGLESGSYEPGPLVIDPEGGVMSEHSIAAIYGWLQEALGEDLPS
ncbi:MAG: aromatic ring-hydroxylating dioxygenase subunit alpha [Rhodospirillaceae bacterium]|jgi:carnitine monooxygenase subunit|nr:aromatic ring-hydroxylating dioxygenase subunit alpha [Rhodospirillaceae bacterium]MBT6203409.1 aromatic ring-hydroxylating dioxygenase subunit alpha [Rhodospirillaceae bacterium]MBT6509003.1 aromatic ring-hydroxylating dioxygenase subunit alpha [Rhodospirillaceae bacterium]MBT7612643.1 aromatic ring-hydroxylating dioxygenase subunit alpha [Rhodospirillaceae bacterium]MBT7647135.1 aromatic ring-hydroxylating dioxygenase subunit alpha [Rhodospirillaceae bacterium]